MSDDEMTSGLDFVTQLHEILEMQSTVLKNMNIILGDKGKVLDEEERGVLQKMVTLSNQGIKDILTTLKRMKASYYKVN